MINAATVREDTGVFHDNTPPSHWALPFQPDPAFAVLEPKPITVRLPRSHRYAYRTRHCSREL